MADNKVPEIAVVRRAYDGVEGKRNKPGTRFAVGREQGGLQVITKARYQTLAASGILRPFGEADTKLPAVKHERPLARTVTTMEGPGSASTRQIRDAARKRTRQAAEPGAPKQVKGPVKAAAEASTSPGSQTGAGAASSVSLGDQALKASGSKPSRRRGTRGAAPAEQAIPASSSSPSTTR